MAIPKFYEFFTVVLEILSDGNVYSMAQLRKQAVLKKGVSEEDAAVLLPSGKERTVENRVRWAVAYLKNAGLLAAVSRGKYEITKAGKTAFAEAGDRIDLAYLERHKGFKEFRGNSSRVDGGEKPIETLENTPQDTMDIAYAQITSELVDDLLTAIMDRSPSFFEKMVVDLLVKMGYGGSLEDAGKVVGQTGDEGIDGIIREDKLGFSNIYIQAKRWDRETTIGRPEIMKFVGALAGQGATKGLFITTARFTNDAKKYAEKQHQSKIVLVDGDRLARLMIEYNLGVSVQSAYEIKKIDSDFFSEEND